MIVKENIKLADVILKHHQLLSIISRFDIKLGFGDKSVKEICEIYNINVDFFLEIVNSFIDEDYSPKKQMQKFSLELIINYLRKTHDFYLDNKIPEIAALIDKMIENSDEEHKKSLLMIKTFFNQYRDELSSHIEREEKVVYPYILKLEKVYNNPLSLSKIEIQELMKYSIDDYEDEHDNISEKVFDLKSIIIKYLPPQDDYKISYRVLAQLDRLEQDIMDHSEMEDRILVPKVRNLENELKAKLI
jgi:regulator of cell morphogenesis and NO signaling